VAVALGARTVEGVVVAGLVAVEKEVVVEWHCSGWVSEWSEENETAGGE
jgi:hypothetical protein